MPSPAMDFAAQYCILCFDFPDLWFLHTLWCLWRAADGTMGVWWNSKPLDQFASNLGCMFILPRRFAWCLICGGCFPGISSPARFDASFSHPRGMIPSMRAMRLIPNLIFCIFAEPECARTQWHMCPNSMTCNVPELNDMYRVSGFIRFSLNSYLVLRRSAHACGCYQSIHV